MKTITMGMLGPLAALALLSSCGGDNKVTLPTSGTIASAGSTVTDATDATDVTLPIDVTLPTGVTLPAGVSLPTDFTVPDAIIDQMITQFEGAGMKVDRTCFKALLQDPALRDLVQAGGTPTPEVMQKFFACITT